MTTVAPTVSARWQTLRAQFSGVIFALAFVPNLLLTLLLSGGHWSAALLIWTLMVGLVAAWLGYWLSGVLLRPLLRLRGEVERGALAAGDADEPGEVQSLRTAFSELLARLDTEQQRRGAFMATLVHDLKTPLIATGHLTELLALGALSTEERREVGLQMLSENSRLLALVQQMADAHRFERDDVRLNVQPTDIAALLSSLCRRAQPRAEQRGVRLHCCAASQRAPADAAVLERAVGNLLDNALRYAQQDVYLLAFSRGGQLHVCVADDGPGLGAELSELAQPFNAQPATIAGQQYTAGTAGLGLFIARRIAEAHGGSLSVTRGPLPASPLPPSLLPASPRPYSVALPFPVSAGESAYTVFCLALPEAL